MLVQLAAERTGFHPVPRTCFRPQPNVDSALVAFRRRTRRGAPECGHRRRSSSAAFAHRRKTLANSLELARGGRPQRRWPRSRELGRPADVRAEALEPEEFLELAELLP